MRSTRRKAWRVGCHFQMRNPAIRIVRMPTIRFYGDKPRFPIPILDWTYKTALKEGFVLKSSIEASLYCALPIEVRGVYDFSPRSSIGGIDAQKQPATE
jgi:hypothetical protein